VHFRPFRSPAALTAASFAIVLGLGSWAHAAGAKDKEAQKLLDSAMNDDYLATEFDKAEKKLKEALTKCGSSGCSPGMIGKLNVALGTVEGVGLNKPADAKAAFIAAFKADPKASLDSSLTTPELIKIFEDANHTPPKEAQVNTPLQLYVEPSDETPLSKVFLKYKPFGATQYKSVEMTKMGKGYGAQVPCEDTGTTGDLKYYFTFTGTDGEGAGNLGTSKDPFKVPVKNEVDAVPHYPGKKAPDQCKEKADCPPGLEGCPSGVKHGDKGWGSSCELTSECKEGLTCLNGACEEGSGGGTGGGGGGPKRRMNLISAGVEIDALILSGKSNVCSPGTGGAYACFKAGTSDQYFGTPLTNVPTTNGISGGFGLGDVAILIGYDRQIVRSLGLSLGVRLGFAIGGSPTPDNVPANTQGALPFLPVHAEGRVTYHILNNSIMEDKKFRPFVFLAGGLAQVNAGVPVTVCDPGAGTLGVPNGCGASGAGPVELKAYQITGRNFFGLGAGTTFGLTPLFGLAFEVKMMFMVPTFGVVFAPTISPVFNF
jgi:hypothetical protein